MRGFCAHGIDALFVGIALENICQFGRAGIKNFAFENA